MSVEQFDPEKVERFLDETSYTTLSPVGDYRGEPSYVRAVDYDALLALYRDVVKQRKFMAGCV